MANTLGREWTPLNLFATKPTGILYASDGYIYISTTNKIFKTDISFLEFTELTLVGSVNTSFGGLAEGPDGNIYAMDQNNHWVKPSGSDTFTRNVGADLAFTYSYWSNGNNVTAFPSKLDVFRHGTVSYGKGAGQHAFGTGIWNGGNWLCSAANLSGWCYEKGVLLDSGDIVFCSGGSQRHSITVFPSATTTRVYAVETGPNNANIYSNHQGSIALEPTTGRLWAFGFKSQTEWFYQYSDDGGVTWSDMTAVTFDGLDNFGAGTPRLRIPYEGHFIITSGSKAYLTEDYFATVELIEDLDGTNSTDLYTFSPSEGTTIALLGTDGTTTSNLYYSIQTPPVDEEPYVEPELLIRWRNDGKSKWSNYRKISLGNVGQTELIKKLRGLGKYRTRQYELVCTSKFPMTIALIEEFVKLGQGGDGSGS